MKSIFDPIILIILGVVSLLCSVELISAVRVLYTPYAADMITIGVILWSVILGFLITVNIVQLANYATKQNDNGTSMHGVELLEQKGKITTYVVLGDNKVRLEVRDGIIGDTPVAGVQMLNIHPNTTNNPAAFVLSSTEEGFDTIIKAFTEAKQFFVERTSS